MRLTIEQASVPIEAEIIIRYHNLDAKLSRLIQQIRLFDCSLDGKKDGVIRPVALDDILYFEAVDNRTFLYTEKDVLEVSKRLYELEAFLCGETPFVRINKSCIINTDMVEKVKGLSSGRIETRLKSGDRLIVSRRYLGSFKSKIIHEEIR